MVSVPGKHDTFLLPDSVMTFAGDDSDEIQKLENFNERLLQFKRKSLLIVNISTLGEEFIEEEHRWKGVRSPNHVVWTSEGVIWANEYSVYQYNGKDVIDLMLIKKGTFKDNRAISRTYWSEWFSTNSAVMYEPKDNQVIIKKSNRGQILGIMEMFIY